MSGAPPFHAMPADLWESMVDGFETAWSGPWTDAMCISDMRYWASRAKNGHDERCPTRRVMQQRWQRSRYHTERIRRDVALWADPHCAVTEDFFSPAPKSDVATFKMPAPAAPPVVEPEVVIEPAPPEPVVTASSPPAPEPIGTPVGAAGINQPADSPAATPQQAPACGRPAADVAAGERLLPAATEQGMDLVTLLEDPVVTARLVTAGVTHPSQLVALTAKELLKRPGVGPSSVTKIEMALERQGMALRAEPPKRKSRKELAIQDARHKVVGDLWGKVHRDLLGESPTWDKRDGFRFEAMRLVEIADVARLSKRPEDQAGGLQRIEVAVRAYLGDLQAPQNWPHKPSVQGFIGQWRDGSKLVERFTGAARQPHKSTGGGSATQVNWMKQTGKQTTEEARTRYTDDSRDGRFRSAGYGRER